MQYSRVESPRDEEVGAPRRWSFTLHSWLEQEQEREKGRREEELRREEQELRRRAEEARDRLDERKRRQEKGGAGPVGPVARILQAATDHQVTFTWLWPLRTLDAHLALATKST